MKFYQKIVPVMFCIMYSVSIFGVDEFHEIIESPLYTETAHIKPYPSWLRKLLSYELELDDNHPNSWKINREIPYLKKNLFDNVSIGLQGTITLSSIVMLFRGKILLPISFLVVFGVIGVTFGRSRSFKYKFLRLFGEKITKLFEPRTYIESLSLNISINENQDSFSVIGRR